MRINPDQTTDLLAAIQRTRKTQSDALQQLASGRRVNSPSDDPAASAMLVQNESRTAATDQFLHNITTLKSVFQTADSTLNSVTQALQQAITLGVEGATGTQSTANRQAIAQQVDGIQQNILGLANLSFNGTYVFAGTKTQAPPYAADVTAASGVRYDGNDQVNQAEIGEHQTVAINMPGSQLFNDPTADVFQALHDLSAALNANDTNAIGTATTAVRAAFDHISSQRVFFGNALNQFDSQTTALNNNNLQFASQQQDLVGADTAATLTDLANAQTSAQATMNATARLLRVSLLDYLT